MLQPMVLADVLAQKVERALPRQRRSSGVVALALVAVEAVLGIVEEDVDFRMRLLEAAHACDGDRGVALPEVSHDGALRLFIDRFDHAAAVVADRAGKAVEPRRRHPGHEATPAIADD